MQHWHRIGVHCYDLVEVDESFLARLEGVHRFLFSGWKGVGRCECDGCCTRRYERGRRATERWCRIVRAASVVDYEEENSA